VTSELLLRFALSRDISTAIVGCSSPAEVQALARAGREFELLTPEEEEGLVELFRPHARRLAFYCGVS
jgi:aryl-alcohol dehydrogenase-like predicted oxidoreductase